VIRDRKKTLNVNNNQQTDSGDQIKSQPENSPSITQNCN
jgi:hypothetical protein